MHDGLLRADHKQKTPQPPVDSRTAAHGEELITGTREQAPAAQDAGFMEEAMLFCPVCSTRLMSLKCKLICQSCGYFMSCADYY
jgi:hypothetical protein